jgi:uncharacterized phage protein (TIGR01671 family)
MRSIFFRGKQAYNDEWAYSEYPFGTMRGGITVHDFIPETVGQYTGLTDKNGKKIYEGDIVTGLFLHQRFVNGVVAFRDGAFGLLWDRAGAETFNAFTSMCNIEYEVIGNIHDNPELLKGD